MHYKKFLKNMKTKTSSIEYLLELKVLKQKKKNPKCRCVMKMNIERNSYKCYKYRCNKERFLFNDTFLECQANLRTNIIYLINIYSICLWKKGWNEWDTYGGCLRLNLISCNDRYAPLPLVRGVPYKITQTLNQMDEMMFWKMLND